MSPFSNHSHVGYLSHANPLLFDPTSYTDPNNGFALFLVQVCIIIILCRLLGSAFKAINQPEVVGEILAGVLLGPTAFGNIPGFTNSIIPHDAIPLLSVTANIGLIFFLFMVGLETDIALMARYLKKVLAIVLPGMAIPFAISAGLSYLVWKTETDQTIKFTTFFVFVGTVMAVTSLSVLSRVAAEMGILATQLGAMTMASGVFNDLLGYILLAIGSALGSGGAPINALYELLVFAGFVVFLWVAVRPILSWMVKRSGYEETAEEGGKVPEGVLAFTLAGALISAFFTSALGVHPILGAITFGICCPHGVFAVKVTEGIESLVMGMLLPLYFVVSGLATDMRLLNDGKTWGLIVLLVVAIFISKMTATSVAARLTGLEWRQALAIGSLMQSKGIIEIIILNVALELNVVTKKAFAMLVVVCLATTITVRPLSRWIYLGRTEEEEESEPGMTLETLDTGKTTPDVVKMNLPTLSTKRAVTDFPITVALSSPNPNVVALMTLISSLGLPSPEADDAEDKSDLTGRVPLDLLRLLPLTFSTSNIMRLITVSDDRRRDVVLENLRHYARLNGAPTTTFLAGPTQSVYRPHRAGYEPYGDILSVPEGDFVSVLTHRNARAQWALNGPSRADGDSALGGGLAMAVWESSHTTARGLSWLGNTAAASHLGLKSSDEGEEEEAHWAYGGVAHLLPARLFRDIDESSCSTGVLIDRGILEHHDAKQFRPRIKRQESRARGLLSGEALEKRLGLEPRSRLSKRRRIIVPFWGGSDDRAAIELVKRMAALGKADGFVLNMAASTEAAAQAAKSSEAREREEAAANLSEQFDHAAGQLDPDAAHEDTINLQTIQRGDAHLLDKLFLTQQGLLPEEPEDKPGASLAAHSTAAGTVSDVGQHAPSSSGPEGTSGGQSSSSSSAARATPSSSASPSASDYAVTVDAGVTFITFPSTLAPDLRTRPIHTSLQTLLPLVDPAHDLVIVGRGKLAQRGSEFRRETDGMRDGGEGGGGDPATSAATTEEAVKAELKEMGRVIGAAAEGLLLGGLGASMLVVQARRRRKGAAGGGGGGAATVQM